MGQFCQRRADVLEALAEALTPVAGHQQQSARRIQPVVAGFQWTGQGALRVQFGAGHRQRIDHGIASDGNVARQVLAQQVTARFRRGRE
ncbi:hypothetical protein G6F65_022833 [Rhizopus arrhizus]|nr:hypothetical protein G6F65_022833 [Rhizopus arrhizus]